MKRFTSLLMTLALAFIPLTAWAEGSALQKGTPAPTAMETEGDSAQSLSSDPGGAAATNSAGNLTGAVDLEIEESRYLTQITEINMMKDEYLGKTIALDGMFTSFTVTDSGPLYHMVYRWMPGGCCGNDGIAGLEVRWANPDASYPAEGDWVRAIGVLQEYQEEGVTYLELRLQSLAVLPQRGQEYVTE